MGRTPGKWLKTLLRKKSLKSTVLKEKDVVVGCHGMSSGNSSSSALSCIKLSNSANRGEELISSKVLLTEIANPPLPSLPIAETNASNEINLENAAAGKVSDNVESISLRNGSDQQAKVCTSLLEDSDNVQLQDAATKAQAAFRGYLARRAFRTLKGIVRLQAFIRGHLVRRQAVATLFCLRSIVKLQILARTRKGSKHSISQRKYTERLWKNAFIHKLLAPSPSAIPLHLRYTPSDPNSEWEWLERWTRSQFWKPISQPKKKSQFKSQVKHQTAEVDQGRPKRSARKLPGSDPEIGSSLSSSQSDKLKRDTGKISGKVRDLVEQNLQAETEKSKLTARKTHSLVKGIRDQVDVDGKKLRQSLGKAPGVAATDAVEQRICYSNEAANETETDSVTPKRMSKQPDVFEAADELHENSLLQLNISKSNGNAEKGPNPKDGSVSNDHRKSSQRRASFPAKIEQQENGTHSTSKVPSYMAPTESAKAKLRAQGSPIFAEDDVGTNGVMRRHSLPSSTNGKVISSSPRVHGLVEASGKGAMKNVKSLTSSRDCGEVIKAEWKR